METRTKYECGYCGRTYRKPNELRGHITGSMVTNGGDHPHWNDLPVSHDDLSAWASVVTETDLSDFA